VPRLRLVILLILASLPAASIGHPQAQQYAPEPEGTCPEPTMGYGAAMSYFIGGGATPGGQNHHLANKNCSPELDLSDQNTVNSTTPASSATLSYFYHVGRGRLNLQAEVNGTGHRAAVPIPGGTNNLNGRGGGHVDMWFRWVDTLTLHSATTKPAPQVKGVVIDPAQVVEIRLKLLNNGHNQCSGGGGTYNYYKTSVALVAETSVKQVMGGHLNFDVDSDCKDQLNEGTIQVLLGSGQFRVELASSIVVNGYAQHGEGAAETVDVKVKLGEYQVCYQVVKGPADLRITSASGTDYTCSKKLPGNTPLK